MNLVTLTRRIAACVFALAATMAAAHDYAAGDIRVRHPFAMPTIPGAPSGAAYLAAISNTGKVADRLASASTGIAEKVEIHQSSIDANGVMRMRELGGMPLAAGETVKMRPGDGYHLMLIKPTRKLVEGDSFDMTLIFERGGPVDVRVKVQTPRSLAPGRKADDHLSSGHGHKQH